MAKVLIIDDEVEIRLFHRILLEELDEYEVIDVGSGAAAREVLAREALDAVVLDFQVPDIDGPQFTNEIRAHYPDLPIIIATGNDRFGDCFKGLNANAIVFKSSGFPDLENTLAYLTANKSCLPNSTYLKRNQL